MLCRNGASWRNGSCCASACSFAVATPMMHATPLSPRALARRKLLNPAPPAAPARAMSRIAGFELRAPAGVPLALLTDHPTHQLAASHAASHCSGLHAMLECAASAVPGSSK